MRKTEIVRRADSAARMLQELIDSLERAAPDLPTNTPKRARESIEKATSVCKAAVAILNLSSRWGDREILESALPISRVGGLSVKALAVVVLGGGFLNPIATDMWSGLKSVAESLVDDIADTSERIEEDKRDAKRTIVRFDEAMQKQNRWRDRSV